MKRSLIVTLAFVFLLGITCTALAEENSAEPTGMDDRVTKLEAKADKLQIFGILGTRYDHIKDQGVTDFGTVFNLQLTFKVNNQFSVVTESEFHRNIKQDLPFSNSPDGKLHDWEFPFLQAHVKGEFDGTTVKLGRFTYIPAYGLVHGNYREVSGGLVSFGNTVKTTLVTGQSIPYWPGVSANSTLGSAANGIMQTSDYKAVDVVIPASKVTNVKAAYQKGTIPLPKEASVSNPEISFREYGFDTKLTETLGLEAALVRSTDDSDNKGSYAKLTYKDANPWNPQSYALFVLYHNLEANSIMGNDIPLESDRKGIRIGVQYTPWMSTLFTIWYDHAKAISDDSKQYMFRTQLDYFF